MNAFTNYLERMGSNFLVSAMVPSLTLVVASILIFDPIIHLTNLFAQQNSAYQLVGSGLLFFILTVLIGFTLTALNTYVLKLYEGYSFFHYFPLMYKWMVNAHLQKARDLNFKRDFLKRRIRVLENSFNKTVRVKKYIQYYKHQYYSVAAQYDHSYPQKLNEILPTQFGNILKASELYTGTRYGFDGVELWPRLLQVIPPAYQQNIDETRNELSFLINMSILSILFFFLNIMAIFYTIAHPPVDLTGTNLFWSVFFNSLGYMIAGLVALGLNLFFYKASIYSVSSFGAIIRSAYDLFRLDLLKQFRLKAPKNSIEEWNTWKNLNEFIVLGRYSLTFQKLEYDVIEKGHRTKSKSN